MSACAYGPEPATEEFLCMPVRREHNIRQRFALERATTHRSFFKGVEVET